MSKRGGFLGAFGNEGTLKCMPVVVSVGTAWLLGIVLLVFLAYWPTTASLFHLWSDTDLTTYTHGYFVLAIVFWLLARANPQVIVPGRAERIASAALLLAMTAVWLVAYRASLQLAHEALLPAIAVLAIWMTLGRKAVLAALFPLGYLYFAMPVWDLAGPVLQSMAVIAVRFLLRGSGITTFFEGNVIHIPAGAFEIAAGCSGLHFFIVAVAIAALYGEMGRDSWRVRLALISAAAAMAIVMNWVRIMTIVLAGHYSNMQHYLVQKDHYTFGWVLFGVFMALFFVACQRWLPPVSARIPEAGHESSRAPWRAFQPVATVVCLLIAPTLNVWSMPRLNAVNFAGLSGVAAGWNEQSLPASRWSPEFPGADRITHQYFTADREVEGMAAGVEVVAAFYAHQSQGKELVGQATSLSGRAARDVSASQPAGNPRWNEWTLEDATGAWLVWHSYRVGTDWYRDSLVQQLAYGWRSIFGAAPSMAVLVRSQCHADCTQARTDVGAYVAALGSGFEHEGEF